MSKEENSNPNLTALEKCISQVEEMECCCFIRTFLFVLLLSGILIAIFMAFNKCFDGISWSANVIVMLWIAAALAFVGLIGAVVSGARKLARYQRGIIKLTALQFEISAGTGLSDMDIRNVIRSVVYNFE